MNLAGELIYCYPDFNEYIEKCVKIEDLYEKCEGFIKEHTFTDSKDNKEKEYFNDVIKHYFTGKYISYILQYELIVLSYKIQYVI